MSNGQYPVQGAGLGLRRDFMSALPAAGPAPAPVSFWEIAPENWLDVGGRDGRRLRAITERTPLVCHGLSLNLGGYAPLDVTYLHRLRRFLDEHAVLAYGDHLSFCADDGHLYELMPIPFTEEAVAHVAARVRQVQDVLGRRITVENASYYCAPGQALREIDFLNAVLAAADCDLLLDVNNVYVNSVNHGYDPVEFLLALPPGRIAYAHIAGHYREDDGLIVDTHGADVIDPVWQLLEHAYRHFGVFPTMVERDFNIPPLPALLEEVGSIVALQQRASAMVAPQQRESA
jgi:uncharacterized protein